tara:strand:+ start:66547 stop:67272 length:726 start_codon:yes stop_codon:yes gene_type:complete
MVDQIILTAENRDVEGKSSSRKLRKSGIVPAVIYGGKENPLRISILEKDIVKASEAPGFSTQIIKITIKGEEQDVILKELQRHPATQRVIHADLMRVDPDTKINISVPVRFINEETCIGVKISGGVISRLINDIDIRCRASKLPEFIEVDVQEMEIGDSIYLSALNLPEGVEIPSLSVGEDRDQAVVSITEAKVLDIEPEVEEIEGEELEGEEGEVQDSEEVKDEDETSSEKSSAEPSEET